MQSCFRSQLGTRQSAICKLCQLRIDRFEKLRIANFVGQKFRSARNFVRFAAF